MQESVFAIHGGATRQIFYSKSLLSTLDNFTAQKTPGTLGLGKKKMIDFWDARISCRFGT
jgi:hypothetical protein